MTRVRGGITDTPRVVVVETAVGHRRRWVALGWWQSTPVPPFMEPQPTVRTWSPWVTVPWPPSLVPLFLVAPGQQIRPLRHLGRGWWVMEVEVEQVPYRVLVWRPGMVPIVMWR